MPRCIIHTGHPKTASTYLQHCLHLNQDLLAAAGVWLPTDFTALGFYDLAALSRQGRIVSGNLGPLHVLLTDGPADDIPAMHAQLFADPAMPAGADLVLSSELFFYYWPSTVELAAVARAHGYTPHIVTYLPRQDQAAISGYLQNVRFHGFSQGVADFLIHDPNVPYCDYLHVLQRIRDTSPGTALTARSFHATFLRQGDILADFLAVIDCPVPADAFTRPAAPSNQGLTLEHYELLRALNTLHDPATGGLGASEVTLSAAERARTHAHYYRPAIARYLAGRFVPANRALLEGFLPHVAPLSAEHAYWLTFPVASSTPTLDAALIATLRSGLLPPLR